MLSVTAHRLKVAVHRPAMHTIFVFTGFLFVSVLLWCFVSFNRVVTLNDVAVVVKVTNCPEGYRFIDPVPDTVRCSVSGEGVKLLVRFMGDAPQLQIDFNKFDNKTEHTMVVPQLKTLIAAMLSGDGIMVTDVHTTGITARYANSSKRVMVALDVDESGFDITDEILLKPDSVTLYGIEANLENITTLVAPLRLEEGVRAYDIAPLIPGSAMVTEPATVHVEVNFIKKVTTTETVVLSVSNVPADLSVTLVPGKVQATYTTTLDHRADRLDTIAIDYAQLRGHVGGMMPLDTAVMQFTRLVENLSFDIDSVEVVVERKP